MNTRGGTTIDSVIEIPEPELVSKPIPKPKSKCSPDPELSHGKCKWCGQHCKDIKVFHWNDAPCCSRCRGITTRCHQCNKLIRVEKMFIYGYCSLKCFIEGSLRTTMRDGAHTMGVEPELLPIVEAAEFYILYLYSISFPELRKYVDAKAQYLAKLLSTYMLYSIGGEMRHYPSLKEGTVARKRSLSLCKTVAPELGEAIASWLAGQCDSGIPRDSMWREWREAVELFGEDTLLEVSRELFNKGNWGGNSNEVGGKKWGLITDALLRYKQGEWNVVIFVDTAFGLKHNGAIHLNKVWNVNQLEKLLDYNREGNYPKLYIFVGEEVKRIVQEQDKASLISNSNLQAHKG